MGKYYNRPASELIFLPVNQHRKLIKGKAKSESHRRHIAESRIGMRFTDEHKRHLSEAHMGKSRSEESKRKQADRVHALKWWTDGIHNVRRIECPDGYRAGRTR